MEKEELIIAIITIVISLVSLYYTRKSANPEEETSNSKKSKSSGKTKRDPLDIHDGTYSNFAKSKKDMELVLKIRKSFFRDKLVSSDDSYFKCWTKNYYSFKLVFDNDKSVIGYWGIVPISFDTYESFLKGNLTHEDILNDKVLNWCDVNIEEVYIYIIGVVTKDFDELETLGKRAVAISLLTDMAQYVLWLNEHIKILGICAYPNKESGHSRLVGMGFEENGIFIDNDSNQPVCYVDINNIQNSLRLSKYFIERFKGFLPDWSESDSNELLENIMYDIKK